MSNTQEAVMAYQEKFQKQFEEQERRALRDRFAMAALTGLLANPNEGRGWMSEWAYDAYKFADCMLKARGDD